MKKQVYAYLHTHWDLEWYRDIEDFNLRFLDVFDIVLDELENNKAPFFYLDGQVIALLNYLKYRPLKKNLIKNLIKDKKLAIGPYYVIADSYLINFCSMLKNLELGLKISREFGQKDFIGYLSDIFGVSKSAFWALKMNNINKALIWRGVNPSLIHNNTNFKYGPINTTYLAQGYFNDSFHNNNIEAIKKYLDKISALSPEPMLLPIGGDHLGILRDANKKIEEINKQLDNYKIVLTNPFEYFEHAQFSQEALCEEFLDNYETFILPGVYSARIYQKIKNAKVQNKLTRIVEPLNFYLKENFSGHIENVYRTLIKNHAHDGIYGCSIDSVHRTIDSRLNKCENILNGVLGRIEGNFKKNKKIKGKSKDRIGLFNLSNFDNIKTIKVKLPYKIPRAQIIKKERGFCDELLYDIYKIPITEDITTLYTQLIEIGSNNKFEFNTVDIRPVEKKVKITPKSIENDFIKLEIKDKIVIKNGSKSFEIKLTDVSDEGDSYNFSPKGEYKTLELIKTKVIYDGEIEAKLRLYFKNIELDITLDNHNKFLKFNSKINNKKKNHKLELSLVLDEKITSTVAQDAFGTISRNHDPNYNIKDFMPARRPKELKTNSYPMQNFVTTRGITALTEGLNEYTIYKNELKICLLRCFSTISNPKNKTRSIPAGPDLKTPEAQCLGVSEARFALGFSDEKEAFILLDEFLGNYIAIDGSYNEKINFKLDKIEPDTYIYGIINNKKIGYKLEKN